MISSKCRLLSELVQNQDSINSDNSISAANAKLKDEENKDHLVSNMTILASNETQNLRAAIEPIEGIQLFVSVA